MLEVLEGLDEGHPEAVLTALGQLRECFDKHRTALTATRECLREALVSVEEKDEQIESLIVQLNALEKARVALSPMGTRRAPRANSCKPGSLTTQKSAPDTVTLPVPALDAGGGPPPRPARAVDTPLSPRTRSFTKNFNKALLCYVHCPGKEPSMSRYYLATNLSFSEHLEAVCSKFRIAQNCSEYALQISSTLHYITAEEFGPTFRLPEEEPILTLKPSPASMVSGIMKVLQDPSASMAQEKMSLYQLRRYLVTDGDLELGYELIRQRGHESLLQLLQSNGPASVISVVLGCLSKIMGTKEFGWDTCNPSFSTVLDHIAKLLSSPNTNVQQNALAAMRAMSTREDAPKSSLYQSVEKALQSNLRNPVVRLVALVGNADTNIQAHALGLINSLASNAQAVSPEEYASLSSRLDAANLGQLLMNQVGVQHTAFKKQVHIYEMDRLGTFVKLAQQPFEAIVPQHKALLVQLWRAGKTVNDVFPGVDSNQWQAFGFKDTNVEKQLKGRMLYIHNLLQYVELNKAKFSKFVAAFPKDGFFPVASSSIFISQTLCDIFGVDEVGMERGSSRVYKMLLNHKQGTDVIAEVHNKVMELMFRAWKALKNPSLEDVVALSGMMQVVVAEALLEDPDNVSKFGKQILSIAEKIMNEGVKDKKKKPSPAKASPVKKAKFKVFEQSLDDIMRSERLTEPDATIPQIVTVLIEAIKKLGGYSTEGIFRVSVKMDELERMKNKIDQGHYDIDFLTPYHPAALLKLWLRELTSPLIPTGLYQEALDAAEDIEATKALLSKLPEVNRAVTTVVATFLQDLGSPQNMESTKMGFSNLALVFAPGFLCSEDPTARLFNSERERMFVEGVIEAV